MGTKVPELIQVKNRKDGINHETLYESESNRRAYQP